MFDTLERSPLFTETTATPAATTATTATPINIFSRAVCLQLTLSRLGTRRKVGNDAIKTDAASDLVHVSADILESEQLDAIRTHDREMAELLRNRASGPALFKGGVYLLSLDLVEKTDAELQAMLAKREELVRDFLQVYEVQRANTADRLGKIADVIDWPELPRVARSFGASLRYLALDTPTSLQGIRADIFERERTKAAAEWGAALDECRQVLRASFADLVSHMAERLAPTDGGKPKVFRDSLVKNFNDFAETFAARNIGDDADLAQLVQKARDVMSGVDAADLRSQEALRAAVARSMADLKAQIDPLVIDKPSRRYNDED